jgi:hypothetical protein
MMDKVVENVVEKLRSRSSVGILKYGTTLEQNNSDEYLTHLQQELMDACNYIEKLLMLKQGITQLVNSHPNDADLGAAIRQMIK